MSEGRRVVIWACGGAAFAVLVNALIGWATRGSGPNFGAGGLELLVLLLVPGVGAYFGARQSGTTSVRWKNAWEATLGAVCIALIGPVAKYAVSDSQDRNGLAPFMIVMFIIASIVAASTLTGFGAAESRKRRLQAP